MSLNPYSWLQAPIDWALRHLTSFFDGVGFVHTVGSFGVAIIVVTLAIRVLLFPLYQWQLKSQRRVQAEQRLLAPQMAAVKKKYKGDPQRTREEIMKLYSEHNISPLSQFSGCLPLLVQIPIIGGLYSGIRSATSEVHNLSFAWLDNLSQSAKDAAGGQLVDTLSHPALLILPVIAGSLTFVQSKISMQPPRPDMTDQERQVYSTTRTMMFMLPLMITVMGLFFYQGIALYWVTQSLVMVGQQWYLLGWGGLNVPPWFPGSGHTPPLSYKVSTQTTLAALGSKSVQPKPAARAKVSSGRSQRSKPVGGRRDAGTERAAGNGRTPAKPGAVPTPPPARRAAGRGTPQTAGGGRRKRGR